MHAKRLSFSMTVPVLLALLLGAGACAPAEDATPPDRPEAAEAMAGPVRVAKAELKALKGSGVSGWVTFTEEDAGVAIEAQVSGLSPGRHGFHIHEWGDCSAPDGTSAGGHFNPEGVDHAGPDAPVAHAGDLGNLEAGEDGHAVLSWTSRRITLDETAHGALGRAVIVHEKPDDLTSQPTGAAGGRVACGVIRLEGGATQPVLPPSE